MFLHILLAPSPSVSSATSVVAFLGSERALAPKGCSCFRLPCVTGSRTDTSSAPDAQHLPAMMAAVEDNLGRRPVQAMVDAGCYSAENIAFFESRGIDGLISVGREKHVLDGKVVEPATDHRAEMRARLHTAIGKGAY